MSNSPLLKTSLFKMFFNRLQKKIANFSGGVVSTVAKSSPIIVDNVGASFTDLESISAPPKELNPSSEAEALSNVASGIAASLGLVAEAASVVASAEYQGLNHSANSTSSAAGPLSGKKSPLGLFQSIYSLGNMSLGIF